jgi:uncharacterized protein
VGVLVVPENDDPRCAVLVLSGSSGRVEVDSARLLAARGAAALSTRWFGDEHVAVMVVSKDAEASLLLASRDTRIRAVAALSPSSVVWANVGPGIDGAQRPPRSSWTEGGEPLRFVPYYDPWLPRVEGPPS